MIDNDPIDAELTVSERHAQWIEGWRRWCWFDSIEDCATACERIGFRHAERVNESGGGRRPQAADAADELQGYLCRH